MPLIVDRSTFQEETARVSTLLRADARFPAQVIKPSMAGYRFVDFDILWTIPFFEFACAVTAALGEVGFSIYVLEPDPLRYYFSHFRSYPVAHFDAGDPSQSYVDTINADPGESPADAIAYRADIVVAHADSTEWVLYGEREFGISVVGARSLRALIEIERHFPDRKIYAARDIGRQLLTARFAPSNVPLKLTTALVENYS